MPSHRRCEGFFPQMVEFDIIQVPQHLPRHVRLALSRNGALDVTPSTPSCLHVVPRSFVGGRLGDRFLGPPWERVGTEKNRGRCKTFTYFELPGDTTAVYTLQQYFEKQESIGVYKILGVNPRTGCGQIDEMYTRYIWCRNFGIAKQKTTRCKGGYRW